MIAAEIGLPESFTGDSGGVARWRVQSEDRMLQKAIKQRWPIPEKYKQAVIDRQVKIAISPDSTPREATSAARVLVAAEAQNQADERLIPEGGQHVHFHQHNEAGAQDAVGAGVVTDARIRRAMAAISAAGSASGNPSGN